MAVSSVLKPYLKTHPIDISKSPVPFPTHEPPQVSSENGQLIATIYGQRYVVTTTLDGIDITDQRDWTGVAKKAAEFFGRFSDTHLKNTETGEAKPLSCELKIKDPNEEGKLCWRSISGREDEVCLKQGAFDNAFLCFVEEEEPAPPAAPKPAAEKRVSLTRVASGRETHETARPIDRISTLDEHLSSLIRLEGFWSRHGITLRSHAAAVIRQMPSVEVDLSWYEKLVQHQVFSSTLSVKENVANYIEEFGVDDAPCLVPLFLEAVLAETLPQEDQEEWRKIQQANEDDHEPVLKPMIYYENDSLVRVIGALRAIPRPQLYRHVVQWNGFDLSINREQLSRSLGVSLENVETFSEGVAREFNLEGGDYREKVRLVHVFRNYLIAQAEDHQHLFAVTEEWRAFLQNLRGPIEEIPRAYLGTFDQLGPLRTRSFKQLKEGYSERFDQEFIETLQHRRCQARLDLSENVDQELAKLSIGAGSYSLADSNVQGVAKASRKYAQAILTHEFETQERFAQLAPFLTKIEELARREDSIFACHWKGSEWSQVRIALINAFEEGIDIELNKLFLFLLDQNPQMCSQEVIEDTGISNFQIRRYLRTSSREQLETRWYEVEVDSVSHYIRRFYEIRLTPSGDERVGKALCHYVAKKLEEKPFLVETNSLAGWIEWLLGLSDMGQGVGAHTIEFFQHVLNDKTPLSEEGVQAVIMGCREDPNVISFVNRLQGERDGYCLKTPLSF